MAEADFAQRGGASLDRRIAAEARNPAWSAAENPRRAAPAWLLSALLHTVSITLLALLLNNAPRGVSDEPQRTGGIVLAASAGGEAEFFSDAAASDQPTAPSPAPGEQDSQGPASAGQAAAALPEVVELSSDLDDLLPALDAAGRDAGNPLVAAAGSMTQSGRPSRTFGDYRVQTGVFGVVGEGVKFVYVFDRSSSMKGYGGRPLAAAKAELIASLQRLEEIHQFQVIFYNERPQVLNPFAPRAARLMFGDPQSKRVAESFIRGIRGSGGTRHMEALILALGMQPDVVFFLTDALEPPLSVGELAEIRRLNGRLGASINTIHFGAGPPQSRHNFLVALAGQNGGQYVYVDVTKLPAAGER